MDFCTLYLNTNLINMHATHLLVCFNTAQTREEKMNAVNWAFKAAMGLGDELTEGINYHTSHRNAKLGSFLMESKVSNMYRNRDKQSYCNNKYST